MKQALRYIENVLSGEELTSETTRLTITRHLADLERQDDESFGYYFSEAEAQKAINFLRILRHPSGEKGVARQKFKVQDNQAFITACIFGWRRKSDDLRRFTEVYFEVPRKWGKSLYAAFIEIYVGFREGVVGAGIFTAATTRDQADEVFRAVQGLCSLLIGDSDKARKDIRVMANSVNNIATGCFIQKVSADAKNLDGKNPICVVLDERHAHETDDVKEVMVSGQGSWNCPMLFTITTAGYNKEGPCFKIDRPNAISVLKGERRNDSLFAIIFCHDTDDADGILMLDPDEPEQAKEIIRLAKKSNPNLGSTPTFQFILDRVRDARNKGSSTRVGVLTKNFNCWLDTPKIWIPEEQVLAVMKPLDLSDYEGRPSFLGIDLAATTDISAVAHFFPEYQGQKAALFCTFWLPMDTIEKRADKYWDWWQKKYILDTPGNITDTEYIRKYVKDFATKSPINQILIDPWGSGYVLSGQLTEDGFEPVILRQTFPNMSEPMSYIERSIIAGEIDIQENPVLLWMFRNVVLATNSEGAIRPDKDKSPEKIDGISASATAVFGWLTVPAPVSSYLLEEDTNLLKW